MPGEIEIKRSPNLHQDCLDRANIDQTEDMTPQFRETCMSMKLVFEEWPAQDDAIEVWLTRLEGEGTVTQASLDFSREAAEEKAAAINAKLPGLATVLGPFVLASGDGADGFD